MDCLGCRIANRIEPGLNIFYENEYVTCVLDIDPFNEGHTLILPKKHFVDVDEIEQETSHAIMDAAKIIAKALKEVYQPDGIRICQDGGLFNDLTHYHMHLIPRYEGDHFPWGEPMKPHDARIRLSETKESLLKVMEERL
ncbi:HIT family protein [Saccharibacillus alkalitolerans]|uniref:HIT family protein n=1 Tax=Saccharibacillus alkalitolerans TaxID=2705290 RepID=A0ABX0F945_9BACL|nr:HIT family protein [Saccharibacillus alkalitolerans]NGZ76915.1 HIT family protein [Saccharibacillus alkalitolerans]